jgi:hypothetical protein
MMVMDVVVMVGTAWTKELWDTGLNIEPRQQWDYTAYTPRGKARETYCMGNRNGNLQNEWAETWRCKIVR